MSLSPQGQAHSQPSSLDEPLDLRLYFEDNKEEGTVGEAVGDKSAAHYLPDNAQRAFFTEERVEQICNELYPEHGQSDYVRMYELSDIVRRYRRILAILLYIGRGVLLIEFLKDPDLDDKHLPFWEPKRFPGSAEDFGLFFHAQWKFHVRSIRYRNNTTWHPLQIQPFKSLGRLGEGNGGQAHLVQIHPAHNKLYSSRSSSSSVGGACPTSEASGRDDHIFVLKIFHQRGKSKEQWLEEARSHVLIRTNDELTKDGGIVNFFGCFSHGSTFAIILEHAPLGNLEDLFQRDERPEESLHILNMWNSFFRLLSTLRGLRRVERANGGAMQMCHFDIKPNNILVFPGTPGRPFSYRFKLGDLGSSTRSPLLDEHPNTSAYTLQKQGTRTYGAPECCRLDPDSNRRLLPPNYVKPDADLWSYGCIASELATWICRGKGGLRAFRESRRDTHDETFADADCFHDGFRVLPFVRKHHRRLDGELEANPCNATVAALQLIDTKMLQFEPKDRKDPLVLLHEAKSMMNQVQRNIVAQASSTSDSQSATNHLAGLISPLPTPEPSTLSVSDMPSVHKSEAQDGGIAHDVPKVAASNTEKKHSRRANSVQVGDLNVTRDRVESFVAGAQLVRRQERRATAEYDPESWSNYPRHGHQPSTAGLYSSPIRSHPSPSPHGRHTDASRTPGEHLPFSEARDSDAVVANLFEAPEIVDEPESYEPEPRRPMVPPDTPSPAPKYIGGNDPDAFPGAVPISSSSTGAGESASSDHIPFLSVHEALLWKERTHAQNLWSKFRKKADKAHDENWRQLQQDFAKRDFHILIDDSHSMSRHWKDVEECASLIAFCTARYDDDGIDVSFMFNNKEKNTKGDKTVLKLVQRSKPPEMRDGPNQTHQRGNINAVLLTILQDYKDKIVQHHSNRTYTPQLKKLVLFVLTDGDWLPLSDAREPLRDLAETVSRHKLPRNQVGVQFIRFGDSKDGKRRLLDLDEFLTSMDIVDAEGWTGGNVWKMLLGSINKDFDRAERPTSDRSESPGTAGTSNSSQRNSNASNLPSSPLPRDQRGHHHSHSADQNGDIFHSPSNDAHIRRQLRRQPPSDG